MSNKHDWLLKKSLRSIDNMHLWHENPRLDPDEEFSTIVDFAEEMTATQADKDDFISLAKSIATKGYIPADPIVLWQESKSKKFYVAEGNRRILAVKLLKSPERAPKSIRVVFKRMSKDIPAGSFNKIPVSIAPTFEDAEWYISQRNSMSSTQRRWTSEQQRRWVMELYDKYNGDVEIIKQKIDLEESELQKNIRLLKIKSIVEQLNTRLEKEEFERAKSFRFPITTLDRFVSSTIVRKEWGLEFSGYDVEITSNHESFLDAYAALVRRMLLQKNNQHRIDSRALGTVTDVEKVLNTLPKVVFDQGSTVDVETPEEPSENGTPTSVGAENGSQVDGASPGQTQDPGNGTTSAGPENQPGNSGSGTESGAANPNSTTGATGSSSQIAVDDPNRPNLIHKSYKITCDKYRITGIFEELQKLSVKSYKNAVAASLRIFLDLCLLEYIRNESFETELCTRFNTELRKIQLKDRLEFIKEKLREQKTKTVITQLLNPGSKYSLDTLNGYQHNTDTHYLTHDYLNSFWSFLFPLLSTFVSIEKK